MRIKRMGTEVSLVIRAGKKDMHLLNFNDYLSYLQERVF